MGKNGNWKKEGYKISHEMNDSNVVVTAHKDNKVVGSASFSSKVDEKSYPHWWPEDADYPKQYEMVPSMVEVHPDHQRKGIASAMYSHAENVMGKKIIRTPSRTSESDALWSQPNKPFGKSESKAEELQDRLRLIKTQAKEWSESGHYSEIGKRGSVPAITGDKRKTALSQLSTKTETRIHDNGETHYLLHRGIGGPEKYNSLKGSHPTHFTSNDHSSWTSNKDQASGYAADYMNAHNANVKGWPKKEQEEEPSYDKPHTESCWIPESSIHSALHHDGAKEEEYVVNAGKYEKHKSELNKGLKEAAMGVAMAGSIATASLSPSANFTPKENTSHQTGIELKEPLRRIAMIESTGGENKNHKTTRVGLNAGQTAGGSTGLMPLTVHEAISKTPELKARYGHLLSMGHEQVTKELNDHPAMENDIANHHWDHLGRVLANNPHRMAYAWRNGIHAAQKASNEEIEAHPYVQKFGKLGKSEAISNKALATHWQSTESTGEDHSTYTELLDRHHKGNWKMTSIPVDSLSEHHSGHDDSEAFIKEYSEKKKAGSEFPAIIAKPNLSEPGKYKTIDGMHRVKAARLAGETHIQAYVPHDDVKKIEEKSHYTEDAHSLGKAEESQTNYKITYHPHPGDWSEIASVTAHSPEGHQVAYLTLSGLNQENQKRFAKPGVKHLNHAHINYAKIDEEHRGKGLYPKMLAAAVHGVKGQGSDGISTVAQSGEARHVWDNIANKKFHEAQPGSAQGSYTLEDSPIKKSDIEAARIMLAGIKSQLEKGDEGKIPKAGAAIHWFEHGFHPEAKAIIENHPHLQKRKISCQDESQKWAKHLITNNVEDVEVHQGFYHPHGNIHKPEGHAWLTVGGNIFDPTAKQFKGTPSASNYQIHETEEHDDLKEKFAKSEPLEKGAKGDWKAGGYKISHVQIAPDEIRVDCHKDEEHVGFLKVTPHETLPHNIEVYGASVDPKHRRKGIATAMYRHAEKHYGKAVAPSADQTKAGKALWAQKARPFGKSESLYKMSRPMITFPNIKGTSTRPDQEVQLLETERQKNLYGHKVANKKFSDVKGKFRLAGSREAHDATSGTKAYAKKISNKFDRNTLGLNADSKTGTKSAAIAGKLRSKFEAGDEDHTAKMAAHNENRLKIATEHNQKMKDWRSIGNSLSGSSLIAHASHRPERPKMPRAPSKKRVATTDLSPEKAQLRGKTVDSTIHHEALHHALSQVEQLHGKAARSNLVEGMKSHFPKDTWQTVGSFTASRGYKTDSTHFKEEVLTHARDILTNPTKREAFKSFAGTSADGHIKAIKQSHQKAYEYAKNVKIEDVKKSESLDKGQNGDWKAEGYKISLHPYSDEDHVHVAAHDKDGKEVGKVEFSNDHESNSLLVDSASVLPKHQRKGLATAMYSFAEKQAGKKIKHITGEENQTEDAKALWANPNRKFGLKKSESLEKISSPHKNMTATQLRSLKAAGWHNPDTGTEIESEEGETQLQNLEQKKADKHLKLVTNDKPKDTKPSDTPSDWEGIFESPVKKTLSMGHSTGGANAVGGAALSKDKYLSAKLKARAKSAVNKAKLKK